MTTMTPWRCTACNSTRKASHATVCKACYAKEYRRQKRTPKIRCTNCKRMMRLGGHGLCSACYTYARRHHGKRRPNRFRPEYCTNCGFPLGAHHRWRGLCRTCYSAQYATGRPRPEHLWRRYSGPLSWCDCGSPAVEQIAVAVHEHTETFRLCVVCAASERDWQRQRGVTGPTPHALRNGAK